MATGWRVVTHGGAGSDPSLSEATDEAGDLALQALEEGADPIDAACESVAWMEADGRFNAGLGSNLRSDGRSVQMDAACSDAAGRFGAVACIERVLHPVRVARNVSDTDHILLAGRGALALAREEGREEASEEQRGRARQQREPMDDHASPGDTVGCVVGDGQRFAAALSSGGTREAMVGRVGDVPLPGCGLRTGPAGAVAATGHGETIARRRIADAVYARLVDGQEPDAAIEPALQAADASLGLIAVAGQASAAASNRSMAYSCL